MPAKIPVHQETIETAKLQLFNQSLPRFVGSLSYFLPQTIFVILIYRFTAPVCQDFLLTLQLE